MDPHPELHFFNIIVKARPDIWLSKVAEKWKEKVQVIRGRNDEHSSTRQISKAVWLLPTPFHINTDS